MTINVAVAETLRELRQKKGVSQEKLAEAMRSFAQNDDDAAANDFDVANFVVTAVPDERKGEKLVVLYVDLPASPEEISKRLAEDGVLPQLWIPAPINYKQVDEIPMLGAGKLDLKAVKQLALQLYGLKDSL